MKKQIQHSSVADMVRSLSEDRAFADEFEKRLSRRQLIKILTILRSRANLSQQELAEKLKCTQSKVSKLESSDDADIRFGDLVNYAEAVDHKMRIFLMPKGQTIVAEVKMHAFAIKHLLHRLVQLAGDDKEMAKGVARFLDEAAFNLIRFVEIAASKLPPLMEETPFRLQVEAPAIEKDSSAAASADPYSRTPPEETILLR
jgi:transcriptional regulator with XRE-family HTH domain